MWRADARLQITGPGGCPLYLGQASVTEIYSREGHFRNSLSSYVDSDALLLVGFNLDRI